jgi:hypothetical protein
LTTVVGRGRGFELRYLKGESVVAKENKKNYSTRLEIEGAFFRDKALKIRVIFGSEELFCGFDDSSCSREGANAEAERSCTIRCIRASGQSSWKVHDAFRIRENEMGFVIGDSV